MRNAFINALYKKAQTDKSIILITGDLGFGVLDRFQQELGSQFLNAGISEQNMLSMAAGMALEGKKVFIYSIANFPTFRCLEQIRNDCAYHQLNVNIISVGAGFSYGSLGMSHHATEDIAVMRALPNVEIFSPADKTEAVAALDDMITYQGVSYIRLGKGKEMDIHHNEQYDVKSTYCVQDGTGELLITTGSIVEEAIIANHFLTNKLSIYTICKLKPINKKEILKLLSDRKRVYILEEHNIIGGLGSIISEIIAEEGIMIKVIKIGLNDIYSSIVGDQKFLRKMYGMDSESILKILENMK